MTDGTPIFARVRLDEYMELGAEAGKNQDAPDRSVDPVVAGTSISDKDTWITRAPDDADSPFARYWDWSMGGQTTYMPTFNKNKDSLQADINGTYAGGDTGTPYGDHVDYSESQYASPGITAEATYDNDNNDIEDDGIRTEEETHTAQQTINGTVITMIEWLERWEAYQTAVEEGTPADEAAETTQVMGDFWVWDDDGWAYWANAIEPSTATGLLLDGIELIDPPSDSYYYGINVVGQFVTADDIGYLNGTGFYDTSAGLIPSGNAEALIELLTGADISLTRVVLESEDDAATVEKDGSLLFRASVIRNGEEVETTEDDFVWSVSGNTSDRTTFYTGWGGYDKELFVDETETAETLTVTATYTDAAGEEVSGSMRITVTLPPAQVSLSADSSTVYQNDTVNLTAAVRDGLTDSQIEGAAVSWSVTGQASDATKVDSTGNLTATLTVGSDEVVDNRLTVTASYYDSNVGQTVTDTQSITVLEAWQSQIANITPGDTDTLVNIDGIDWKVLAKDGDKALIWAAESVGEHSFDNTRTSYEEATSVWRDADIRTWLQNWLENDTTILKNVAQETTLYTRDSTEEIGSSSSGAGSVTVEENTWGVIGSAENWIQTIDKVFLLSEADLFGTYNGEPAEPQDYTYGYQLTTSYLQRQYDGNYSAWLRNAYSNSCQNNQNEPTCEEWRWQCVALLQSRGLMLVQDTTQGGIGDTARVGMRSNDVLPALWIDFSMD